VSGFTKTNDFFGRLSAAAVPVKKREKRQG